MRRHQGHWDGPTEPSPRDVVVEDGYAFICPHCYVRHGESRFGVRTVDVKECPADKCNGVIEVHAKNFSKKDEVKFTRSQPDTAFEQRRNVDVRVVNGRKIYRSVEHLL